MSDADIRPRVLKDGVPSCSLEDCPSYDGKRCRILGHRPDGICEPAVVKLAASLTTALEVARRAEANSRQDFQAHEKAEAELCAAETERDEARRQLGERDEMLLRWLTWEGRSDDTASPIEAETAKMLGHTEECELVEYGVCTCERATIPTPSPPPRG